MQTARTAPTPIPALAPVERPECEFKCVRGIVAPEEEAVIEVEVCSYSHIVTKQRSRRKCLHLQST